MGIPLHSECGDLGFYRRLESADGSEKTSRMASTNLGLLEKLFTFEVDILRNDACDISLNQKSYKKCRR